VTLAALIDDHAAEVPAGPGAMLRAFHDRNLGGYLRERCGGCGRAVEEHKYVQFSLIEES